ncbi:MAG: CHAT domain-containing protein, partial [Halothece sp. Uz-M2-17]|nr:CHAT domain-containing protein [Halothece sp. Uz-M2-17]
SETLSEQGVENLVFIMPEGLRLLPVAALHDGEQFLVEQYSLGLSPSLSLTDTRYKDIKDLAVLAAGASKFADPDALGPLPAVEVELPTIANELWQGQFELNENFTLESFRRQREQNPEGIIHMATHADFRSGNPEEIYIQFYDQKVRLDEIRQLNLNDPPVELLVLSACRTAVGNENVELGFAGLTVQAGVKSALASLWYVGDTGTVGLMSEFYRQLNTAPIKAEAMRQAQLAMLEGAVRLEGEQIITPGGELSLPAEVSVRGQDLSHPYYWAAFTLVGSPW